MVVLMKPRVVRKIVNHDGTVYRSRNLKGVKVFDTRTCHEILKSMAAVVEEGTAKRAAVPGYRSEEKPELQMLWLMEFMHRANIFLLLWEQLRLMIPRIVVLVKIDEPEGPGWGGTVAAPLFGKICSQILWRLGVLSRRTEDLTEIINAKR
jgi:cell division protein FtsI/penicillin-binding protein 2